MPIALMWVAIAMAVISSGVAAYSSIQQGKQQSQAAENQAEYNRQVAESQAKQAKNEADWAEYNIAVMEETQRQKKLTATETARQQRAASSMALGITSGSGSLLANDIYQINELGKTLNLIDWETNTKKIDIEKNKGNYLYQSSLYKSQADYATLKGQNDSAAALQAGYMGAGTSLLAGGASVANIYTQKTRDQNLLSALRS